jgi:hypothetical protein
MPMLCTYTRRYYSIITFYNSDPNSFRLCHHQKCHHHFPTHTTHTHNTHTHTPQRKRGRKTLFFTSIRGVRETGPTNTSDTSVVNNSCSTSCSKSCSTSCKVHHVHVVHAACSTSCIQLTHTVHTLHPWTCSARCDRLFIS